MVCKDKTSITLIFSQAKVGNNYRPINTYYW